MLNWSREQWNPSAPDLVIVHHALLRDTTFSLGAIGAKWLSLNRTKGPIFRGIFASRLAKHFEIPIRHYEKEEKLLPTIFLDYKSMIRRRDLSITWYLVKLLVRLLPCLHHLCLTYIQAHTSSCPMKFMHTGSWHEPQSLSQSHLLIHIRSLFISGIHRSSLTSGMMTHKCRGSIIVLSISKGVKPNVEQKEMSSGFQQGIFCRHWNYR